MNDARVIVRRGLFVCWAVLLLTGCSRGVSDEPGVVATVNGDPIRAEDLEARHDLRRLGTSEVDNPAVERLRAEYGAVLADMIVARLVRQELSRLHLSVTEAERTAAEKEVLADYPEGAFERMLLEERIDAGRWREILGDRLAVDKFTREVLRQNVRVGVSEAANYYKEHIDAFTQPPGVRLALVSSKEAEAVKAAVAAYRKSGQLAALDGMPGVMVRTLRVPEKNLPAPWREAIKQLKPGEASAVMTVGRESSALILQERLPVTVLDPAKAYARVEAVLLRDKLAKAFDAWLAEALAGAKIAVSSHLVATVEPAGDKKTGESSQAELTAAKTESTARDYLASQAKKALADRRTGQDPDSADGPEETSPSGARDAPAVRREDKIAAASSGPLPTTPAPAPASPAMDGKDLAGGADNGNAAASRENEPANVATPVVVPAAPTAANEAAAEATARGAALPPAAAATANEGGEAEFLAVKASWILYTVDGGQEERQYIKPGKPHRIAFRQKLTVRLGSPSEVTYRFGGKETTVEVGKKESRILEFP
jgi:hypothetical protein